MCAPPNAARQDDDRARLLGGTGPAPRAWHVAGLRRPDARAFARPHDFARGAAAAAIPRDGSIYALDPVGGAAWLCDVPYRDLVGAPFAYARQAERARVIARLPAAALPAPAGARPAIGLFSIGRCGSTLLSRILGAAGAQVLSELDAFTAIGQAARRWPSDPAVQARLTRLAGAAIGAAGAALPPGDLVLKFRSQAMQAAQAITAAGLRPVLLVRGIADWAVSNARHFPADPPEGRVDAMARGLQDMAALPRPPCLLAYERVLADPVGAAETCLGRAVPAARHDAIRACLGRHSQSGTALERPRADASHRDLARAADLWSRLADPGALRRLGIGPDLLPLTPRA